GTTATARGGDEDASGAEGSGGDVAGLPAGLRLELIDPGEGPAETGTSAPDAADEGAAAPPPAAEESRTATLTAAEKAVSRANAGLAPLGATEIPALNRARTEEELLALRRAESGTAGEAAELKQAKPYIGPRPAIKTRKGWGAN